MSVGMAAVVASEIGDSADVGCGEATMAAVPLELPVLPAANSRRLHSGQLDMTTATRRLSLAAGSVVPCPSSTMSWCPQV